MKVLVTGANGFIGSALIEYLSLSKHVQVVGMLRPSASAVGLGNVNLIRTELAHLSNFELSDIDVIIHTAGRAHEMRDSALSPIDEFRKINTDATLNLAKLAANAGVIRFIFLSSVKVNGEATLLGSPFSAFSPVNPQDPYAISKSEAEYGLREISTQTGLQITIIRPPLVYGPGVKGNFDILTKLIYAKVPLPLAAIKFNRRSMVGIDNLVSLLESCIFHPNAANETFLVSDNFDVSTHKLLTLLGNAIDKSVLMLWVPLSVLNVVAKLFGKSKQLGRLVDSLQVDISHTRARLNWKPPYTMNDGFRKMK
jgi:UDP-glucose 4-epimerase